MKKIFIIVLLLIIPYFLYAWFEDLYESLDQKVRPSFDMFDENIEKWWLYENTYKLVKDLENKSDKTTIKRIANEISNNSDIESCEFSEKDVVNILLFSNRSKLVADYLADNNEDMNRIKSKDFKESCYNLFNCKNLILSGWINIVWDNNKFKMKYSLEKDCIDLISYYYNKEISNVSAYNNMNFDNLGDEIFFNSTTEDSSYDILWDIKDIYKLLFLGSDEPQKVFYYDDFDNTKVKWSTDEESYWDLDDAFPLWCFVGEWEYVSWDYASYIWEITWWEWYTFNWNNSGYDPIWDDPFLIWNDDEQSYEIWNLNQNDESPILGWNPCQLPWWFQEELNLFKNETITWWEEEEILNNWWNQNTEVTVEWEILTWNIYCSAMSLNLNGQYWSVLMTWSGIEKYYFELINPSEDVIFTWENSNWEFNIWPYEEIWTYILKWFATESEWNILSCWEIDFVLDQEVFFQPPEGCGSVNSCMDQCDNKYDNTSDINFCKTNCGCLAWWELSDECNNMMTCIDECRKISCEWLSPLYEKFQCAEYKKDCMKKCACWTKSIGIPSTNNLLVWNMNISFCQIKPKIRNITKDVKSSSVESMIENMNNILLNMLTTDLLVHKKTHENMDISLKSINFKDLIIFSPYVSIKSIYPTRNIVKQTKENYEKAKKLSKNNNMWDNMNTEAEINKNVIIYDYDLSESQKMSSSWLQGYKDNLNQKVSNYEELKSAQELSNDLKKLEDMIKYEHVWWFINVNKIFWSQTYEILDKLYYVAKTLNEK